MRISRGFWQHAVRIANAHSVVPRYLPTARFFALNRTPFAIVREHDAHVTSKGISKRIVGAAEASPAGRLRFFFPDPPFPSEGFQSGG